MKRTKKSTLTAVVILMIGWLTVGTATTGFAEEEEHVLKVATLAPADSSWGKAFKRMAREVKKETDGKVEIKLYPNGVMGDEPAMVRKMRTGQLDGAALTNVGLGKIDKQVLALQLPLLFENWDEVDYVRGKMSDTFEEMLSEKGFQLLTWGDVGFSYIFSKKPIKEPSDIQSVKLWVWESDPIMSTVAEVAEVNAVPLELTDVLPSLSTGVINAFTNSPYGAVSLQWYSRADYVTNLKLAVVVGGIVMRQESLEELPEKYQELINELSAKHGKKLLAQIREDNKKAIGTITGAGVEPVKPKKMEKWRKLAEKTREELTGDVFPASLVNEMKKHLEDFRD